MAKRSSLSAVQQLKQSRKLQRERTARRREKLKNAGMKTVSVIVPEAHEQKIKRAAESIHALASGDETVVSLRVPKAWEPTLTVMAECLASGNYEGLERLLKELVELNNCKSENRIPHFPELSV